MCAVIGYFANEAKPEHVEMIHRLMMASKIRGLHAFGYSIWNGNTIATKKFDNVESCQNSLVKSKPFRMLISHNRYSTSGDYKNPDNNQPLHITSPARGSHALSLVFNGVISQATKEEYSKQYDIHCQTDNDGEIFARKVLDGEDWANWVSRGRFSFAGIFIHKGEAWMIRNKNRPLWYSITDGAVFVASTEDIFGRAEGFEDPFPVPINQAHRLSDFLKPHED